MSLIWTLVFVISAPAVLIILWYYQYYRYQKYLSVFPGPKPIPLLGNSLDFSSTADILSSCIRYRQKFRGDFQIFIGFQPALVVTEQKTLEFILSSTKLLTKSNSYRFLQNWLGTGVLTSTNEKWKKHRKIITPTFHFQILEKYLEVFHSASYTLIKKLGEQVGKGVIDIYPYITTCALDIICESAMGTSVNAQEDTDSDYVRGVEEVCRIVVERTFSPIQQYDLLYHFSENCRTEKAALKVLHNYTDSVIKKKKAGLYSSANQNSGQDFDGVKKKMAFLDLLLSLSVRENALTDTELREEVDTFMFAGHDTTASSMSFALYCLSKNIEAQNKVFKEIKHVFSNDRNRAATYQDLQEMKYLDLVLKETLRLYPAVPIYGRELAHDVKFDGKLLPKGLTIMMVPYAFHRDPEKFPHPEKFDPDRFLLENMQGKSSFSYLPFSAGPRNCIGQKFALLEMKSTLSKILMNFEVLPPVPAHELKLVAEGVLKSKNGILVQLRKRNWI